MAKVEKDFNTDAPAKILAILPKKIGESLNPLNCRITGNRCYTNSRFQFNEVRFDDRNQEALARSKMMLDGPPCHSCPTSDLIG